MTGTALHDLQQIIGNRSGSRIAGSITDRTTDRQIGFRADLKLNAHEREPFVLTAFQYLPPEPETIGVMEKLVKIGCAESKQILVYFNDRPFRQSMVFDPVAYKEHGVEETKNTERRERKERWLNLPRDYACSIEAYADGTDTPRVEAPEHGGKAADGGWFNV